MKIPEAFAEGVRKERGPEGLAWLQELPFRFLHYCQLWDLQPDGQPWHGYLGMVLPVRRQQEKAALKITWVDEETRHEAEALRQWDGQGAVRLLEAEEGVLLLERLNHAHSLAHEPILSATSTAAGLLRRLAIPARTDFLDMADYAQTLKKVGKERWHRLRPFPYHWLQPAPEPRERLLVNQDLHYQNVLQGQREPWLVIDPKVLCGDVEFGVAPLLWNRWRENDPLERFDQIIHNAALDRERAVRWTLLRILDYWLWALDLGFSEDPKRCRELADLLRSLESA